MGDTARAGTGFPAPNGACLLPHDSLALGLGF
jgi:hypothetical protein